MSEDEKSWPSLLAQPIDRKPPWLSMAQPSPSDESDDLKEAAMVGFAKLAKLPALASHFGIGTAGKPLDEWISLLAVRLATELGIPGFQERWVGARADDMRKSRHLSEKYSTELGIDRKRRGRKPGGFSIPLDSGERYAPSPHTVFWFARILQSDSRAKTDRDAAEFLAKWENPALKQISNRSDLEKRIRTLENIISIGKKTHEALSRK